MSKHKKESVELILSAKTSFDETLLIYRIGSEVRVKKIIDLEATVADAVEFIETANNAIKRTMEACISL